MRKAHKIVTYVHKILRTFLSLKTGHISMKNVNKNETKHKRVQRNWYTEVCTPHHSSSNVKNVSYGMLRYVWVTGT